MSDRSEVMDQEVNARGDHEGKYLTFTLAKEEYGVNTMKVNEIIGMMKITACPELPHLSKESSTCGAG